MDARNALYGAAVVAGLVVQGLATSALFLAIAWALCAYFMPVANCRRCRGSGHNQVTRWLGLGPGNRRGPCRRCKGTGARQVLGSRTVHRTVRSLTAWRHDGEGK